jgi:hypothetical protein
MAKRFRVAFSFASEKRVFVSKVADILAQKFGKEAILYDKFHEAEFCRPKLVFHLTNLYGNHSDLVVCVFSKEYTEKEWCGLEWQAIYSLIKQKSDSSIMLSRFDKSEPEGLFGLDGFSELDEQTPYQFATLVLERLALNNGKHRDYYTKRPRSNLPTHVYSAFLGREKELAKLFEFLSPAKRSYVLSIDGIGGIGKTALAVEAARRCSLRTSDGNPDNLPFFEAVIFASAKSNYLRYQRILPRPARESSLSDVFRVISEVLDDQSIMQTPMESQARKVYDSLKRQSTLLIIDNLETFEGGDDVHSDIMSFLEEIPAGTKAILTSRIRNGYHVQLNLGELNEKESIKLARTHAEENGIKIIRSDAQLIYKVFGGIPLAIINAVGLKGCNYDLSSLLDRNDSLFSNTMEFCFEEIKKVLSIEAYAVFKCFGLFMQSPVLSALAKVAGFSESFTKKCIDELTRLSLVRQDNERYHVVSFTSRYARLKLEEDYQFAADARNRWIEWYKSLSKRYGYKDKQEWSYRYSYLKSEHGNLQNVLQWCFDHERIKDVKVFWSCLENYLDVCGYWQDRIIMLDYLIEKTSNLRRERGLLAEAFASKGWTMTLLGGQYKLEAQENLMKAYFLRRDLDAANQARLANYFAVFRATQKRYAKALLWLRLEEKIAKSRELERRDRLRAQIRISYYRGEIAFNLRDFDHAASLFEKSRLDCSQIGWERFNNYANNWLAEIAIIRGDYSSARQMIRQGLAEAQHNGEQRRIAHYHAAYARLEYSLGNYTEVNQLAEKALRTFKREDMREDIEKITELLISRNEMECEQPALDKDVE